MTKNKNLHLLITRGEDEEVLVVLEKECIPNQFGEIVPPITVEYKDQEYILKRKCLKDTYVYGPSNRKKIDDLLD